MAHVANKKRLTLTDTKKLKKNKLLGDTYKFDMDKCILNMW